LLFGTLLALADAGRSQQPEDRAVLYQGPVDGRMIAQGPGGGQEAGPPTRLGEPGGFPPAGTAKADKEKETYWSRIPDLPPVPRPGQFILPPQGEGYYFLSDLLKGEPRDKAPISPWRGVFYDNDFRYLDQVDGKPVDCFDDIKRIHLGGLFGSCADDWLLSVGGEFRYRLMNEIDSRLTAKDNRYDLTRTRVYGDLWYKDLFRVYVEYYDAQSYSQDLPPLPIDVNHSDLLNAFVDIKLAEIDDHPVYARVGRQELLYGSQRLISPLDWANTRRTFEGAKVFWHNDKWSFDAFWTRPVPVSPGRFDAADANRQFAGAWASYRPDAKQTFDAYYLYLDNDIRVGTGFVPGGRGGYDLNTIGGRWNGWAPVAELMPGRGCGGAEGNLLWDFEGGMQLGDFSARNVVAGFATAGVGYCFKGLPMQPQFWAYFDYASGTPDLTGTGVFSTFNQLFPFGHYYLGYLDLVGRENIKDWNFQLTCYPTKWVTLLAQYHVFNLSQAGDALYGPAPGYPIERLSPNGSAGTDVGQELDLYADFRLSRHQSVLIGWSKLYEGNFIRNSGPSVSPELFYVQYTFRW
jgi:hypothetical protein